MGKPRIFSEEEIADIYYKYYEEGLSLEKLAKEYKAGRRTITNIFKKNGWKIKSLEKIFSQEDIDKVIYSYVTLGRGLVLSGREIGVCQDTAKKILLSQGIKVRTYVEAKDGLRKYSINDNFFKTQSHNMAYILGLLASDGNVSLKENQISIALDSKDGEILEKINVVVENSRPVKYYSTGEGRHMAKFVTYSSIWKKDLANYGIIPRKTYTLKPPTFLHPEYHISYIRGLFDGDGSCGYAGVHSPCWNICGASKEVLEWVRNVLSEQYGIYNNKIYTSSLKSEIKFYNLQYYGIEKIQKLFNALYNSNGIYLERKYEKLCEINTQETVIPEKQE